MRAVKGRNFFSCKSKISMCRIDDRRVATAIHFPDNEAAGVKACTPGGVTRSASASVRKQDKQISVKIFESESPQSNQGLNHKSDFTIIIMCVFKKKTGSLA